MSTRKQLNQQFAKMLQQLNPAQRKAVEAIEGPVLVVAGPGTGKTHILAARIGQILTQTDTQPYAILCLTFTEAAAQAMRKRLAELIGRDAQRVHIFTFHAFCNKIIQDNLDLFGKQDLHLLDDLERQQFLRKMLESLPPTHILTPPHDVYQYERHLSALFQVMKTEAWTAKEVSEAIDTYLETLPTRPEFIYQNARKGMWEKGELKKEALEEERQKMERLRAAAHLYPQFLDILRGERRYDFDDMILWVNEAFERFPFLLRNYQEQFLYFLVDEYQDTNGAQNKILQQLIGYWESPNIFIVGDDDQAIYEFQGARLKSLIDFYDRYRSEVETVVLTENYRSTQSILDIAKKTIDNNKLRIINSLHNLKIDKRLKSVNQKDKKTLPQIVEYTNRLSEVADILGKIEARRAAGKPLSEVAIIYSQHREAEYFISIFEKKGIPYTTRRKVNVLTEPLVEHFCMLLTYFQRESEKYFSGDYLLYKILNINFLEISENDIFAIARFISNENAKRNLDDYFADDIEKQGNPFLQWREVLDTPERLVLEAPKKIEQFNRFLITQSQNIHNQTLIHFIETVANQSGLIHWVLAQPNKIFFLEILNTFFDFVKNEILKRPHLRLSDLLETFDLMNRNRIPLAWVQNIVHTEGVVLTTAHSAKGLEFEQVFVINAAAEAWEEARGGHRYRFKLPDTLTLTREVDALEARRRLFYVALTRAKQQLQISVSQRDTKGKEVKRSLFLSEIATEEVIEKRQVAAENLVDLQEIVLSNIQKSDAQSTEKEYINDILSRFTMSVSALDSYLNCPLGFYYEHILQVPNVPSANFGFGRAVHAALRRLFMDMLRHKEKEFAPLSDFLRFFEVEMLREKTQFEHQKWQRRVQAGKAFLTKYYKAHIENWAKNVAVERSYRAEITENDKTIPIKGIIDKIIFADDGNAHIVDYKTGKNDAAKLRRPTVRTLNGGTYWRQLVFYKMLYETYRGGLLRVRTGIISSIEPDINGIFEDKTLDFEPKDEKSLRKLILTTWENIQAHKFEGCGKPDCDWCNFDKNKQPLASFWNEANTELDDDKG